MIEPNVNNPNNCAHGLREQWQSVRIRTKIIANLVGQQRYRSLSLVDDQINKQMNEQTEKKTLLLLPTFMPQTANIFVAFIHLPIAS